MSDSGEMTRASERIIKQIQTLGELRNAGPRDQRFKLWRQDTLTLLQRLWPGDHDKAERFRRIPFSAPIARSDRGGTREYFERGCKEAASYLDGLAFELGSGIHAAAAMFGDLDVAPEMPETTAPPAMEAPGDAPGAEPLAPPPAVPPAAEAAPEPARQTISPRVEKGEGDKPISFLNRGAAPKSSKPAAKAKKSAPRTPPVTPPPAPAEPRAARPEPQPLIVTPITPPLDDATPPPPRAATTPPPSAQPKMRLKDMLGFGDDGQAQAVEPPRAAAPPPIIESDPLAAEEPADAPEFVDESEPESESAGETTADTVEPRYLAAEFVLDSAVLQSKGQPLRRTMVDPPAHAEETPVDETEAEDLEPVVAPPLAGRILPMPAPAAAAASLPMTLAAEEIYTLATSVTNFGVPPSQSSIIRATLIDLGRQLETPPVHWASLRDSVAFAMEYPELARRLLPLVLPYLQQAA